MRPLANLPKNPNSLSGQLGFALLEILVSMLIFTLGILGVVGLQGSLMSGAAAAQYQVEASLVAQRRAALVWATDAGAMAGVTENAIDISAESGIPNATRTTTLQPAGTVLITVTWAGPDGAVRNYTLSVDPRVCPPLAVC